MTLHYKMNYGKKDQMNHLDLFSGIGGFSLGLKLAGVEPKWIGYSDIDKYANQVFKRRFPNAKELGSIIDIRPDELPNIDLITFGFPCQDLSIAGKRGGLKANRSSLFFKAVEIIRHKKPKYFVFENVKGLFSANGGQDFLLILRAISDIGYDGQWQLLNTRWFLPQNRERVYFVGHIRGECRPKVFPIGEDGGEVKKDGGGVKISNSSPREFGWKDRSPAVYARDYKDTKLVKKINIIGNLKGKDGHECHNVHSSDGIAPTVRENHGKVTMVEDFRNDEGLRIRKDSVSPCLATRKHSETDISTMPPIVKVHTTQHKKTNIRRLTPTETCRLQGFPDDWNDMVSDTQRYKQTGNAVSVPVVKAIMERLYGKKDQING